MTTVALWPRLGESPAGAGADLNGSTVNGQRGRLGQWNGSTRKWTAGPARAVERLDRKWAVALGRVLAGSGGMTDRPSFPADLVLTTERLRLRPLADSDLDTIVVAGSDPLTQMWLPLPRPYAREHAEGFVHRIAPAAQESGRGLIRAIEFEGDLAGAIDFKGTDWSDRVTEIGYWAAPAHRGRGVMTEAVVAMARYALTEAALERVVLRMATGTTASAHVAEKAGFTREGVARNAGFTHDGRVDYFVYSLIRTHLLR
jgi:RimJ/RimL family protein N-acetyltransferase